MGCIEHKQKGNKAGYGMAQWNGRMIGIHRKAYCVANGVEPDAIAGLDVRHKCDNPRCINPEHLELGSRTENMDDARQRGRLAVGERCKRALTAADVATIRKEYQRGTSGEYGQYGLAKRFGVSQGIISRIVNNKDWKL